MISPNSNQEAVILLHGIGLSKWSLIFIKNKLKKAEYNPVDISYPSTKLSLNDIADWLNEKYLTPEFWDTSPKVHFVTHSMGGLVARRYLNKYRSTLPHHKIGRVVMLGTPNHGSEVADIILRFPPYKWLYGPAGQELATSAQAHNTDTAFFETGIIAGSAGWLYPISSHIIKEKNDGRVAIEKTKLDNMKDHIVMKSSHTFMIYRNKIHDQIISFLRNGYFKH